MSECSFCHNKTEKLESIVDPTIPENQVFSRACDSCYWLISKIQEYKRLYYECKDANDRSIARVNMFKSVMLSPETIAANINEPTREDVRSFVTRKVSGLEVLPLDELLEWMEVQELYTKKIAELVHKKASKEEIQQHLEAKTKEALKAQAKAKTDSQKESKEKKEKVVRSLNDGLLGTYEPAERKVIQGIMKALKLDEVSAILHCHTMGMLLHIEVKVK